MVPFRGQYSKLVAGRRDLINGLVYPVPDPSLPFLGVHFTRRIDDEVLIGPNAVLALARHRYGTAGVQPARRPGDRFVSRLLAARSALSALRRDGGVA